MIALDTNVLVYAHRPDLRMHERAFDVVTEALGGTAQVGLCWPVLQEFLAVVTNARIFSVPTPLARAFDQVEHWLASPRAMALHESANHMLTLRRLAVDGRATGGALHDAKIAALCLDHGISELITADRDFSRFPDLRVRNPFVGRRVT